MIINAAWYKWLRLLSRPRISRAMAKLSESPRACMQYGCGWTAPTGWINFDSSPTLRFERLPLIGRLYTKNEARFPATVRYGDVVRGLPLPDGACSAVYASHVLEHLSRSDFEKALAETYRVLCPGGVFRAVVPDLEYYSKVYVKATESGSAEANDDYMRDTGLGTENRPSSLFSFVKSWLGNSQHLWMWDYPSLAARLKAHGFNQIRRAEFNDSKDPRFKQVESKDRFSSAVAVEATKPDM